MCAVALAGCGSGQRHESPPPAHSSKLESIFEDETALHSNPAAAFDAFRKLGVQRVRVYLPWSSFAPDPTSRHRPPNFNATDPAAYSPATLALFDTIVRAGAAHRIALDFTVGGPPPLWAAAPGGPRGQYASAWMPSARAFGAFVHAIGTRYDGRYTPPAQSQPLPRIDFWSIWNEPNYGPDLAPQTINGATLEVAPRLYRGLLDAAWKALQATGHGHDTILIGELAPRGQTTGNLPGSFGGMVPLRFVRALYCLDSSMRPLRGVAATERGCPATAAQSEQFRAAHPILFNASGFAAHPYPQGGMPPDQRIPEEPDYADLASLPELISTLDHAQAAYGSSNRFPIYSTEFGYQTNPPETIAHTTDPVTAGRYLNWSEYISWRNPRIRSYDQYLLTDPPGANALGGFATGLEFKTGVRKATYTAYRMPLYLPVTTANRRSPLEVWGCARPAVVARSTTGRPQQVEVQFRSGTTGAFHTIRKVPVAESDGCYFDVHVPFDQSGSVRLRWSYPHGATIHSRVQSVTVH